VRFVRTNTPTPAPPSCSYAISHPQNHSLLVGKSRTKRPHERKLRTKPLLLMISGTCLGSTSSASFLHPASKRRRLDPLRLETFAKGNGRAPLRGRLLVRSPHLIRETPEQKPLRAGVTFNHQQLNRALCWTPAFLTKAPNLPRNPPHCRHLLMKCLGT
jgi:hypothetical protein